MAKEKIKKQIKFERPIIKQRTIKSKRKKHETECSIKKMRNGCGMCGSTNIGKHGVRYCTKCNEEIYYFIERSTFYWLESDDIDKLSCKCMNEYHWKRKWYSTKPEKFIYVSVCLDCGATQSNYCPVCGKDFRECWKGTWGDILCQKCNYRKPSTIIMSKL